MGHFSYNCSISGLGISGGTPVRCFLLTASPYGDDARKTWVVRTPPIRAEYNDYGTIENINPADKFICDLWLRGLQEDLVEKGMGDNSCHDLPTSKDMSFEQLLEALQSGRVQVSRDVKHFWHRPRDIGDGEDDDLTVPTFKHIEKLLKVIDKQYRVDEPVPNLLRVRFGNHVGGDALIDALKTARAVVELAGFVTVITAGSGRYASYADLLVFNPPSEDHNFAGPHWDMATGQKSADDKIMIVSMAMVREDVWQALITYPREMGVYLDCLNCGQQSFYHGKDRQCPYKSINKKPYKAHKEGAQYKHGPLFPAGVDHLVVQQEYGEKVWYGLSAFMAGVHGTWKKICTYFDKQDRRLRGESVKDDSDDKSFFTSKFWKEHEADRKKEAARIAALPAEERTALEATSKAQQERWEAREKERRENPVFGDYLVSDVVLTRGEEVGGWVFYSDTPGVLSVSEHMSMCLADKKEVPTLLLDGLAELMAVQCAMGEVGVVWKPAASTGPQDVSWPEHVRFAETIAEVSRKNATRQADRFSNPDVALPTTLQEAFMRCTATKENKKKKKENKKTLPKVAKKKGKKTR